MKQSLLAMLNDAEQALVRDAEPANLATLDEDDLLDLHTRVRRARTKYSKLYRRLGARRVAKDAARGRASASNQRTAAKAEIFETALAQVSRRLAVVARESAAELRTERIQAARAGRGTAERSGTRAGTSGPPSAKASRSRQRGDSAQGAIRKKKNASTLAKGARRQAKRDSR